MDPYTVEIVAVHLATHRLIPVDSQQLFNFEIVRL